MATSNPWFTGCSYLLSALATLLCPISDQLSLTSEQLTRDVAVLEFPACGGVRKICRLSLSLLWHPEDLEQQTLHFFIHSTLLEPNGEMKNMEKAKPHQPWQTSA